MGLSGLFLTFTNSVAFSRQKNLRHGQVASGAFFKLATFIFWKFFVWAKNFFFLAEGFFCAHRGGRMILCDKSDVFLSVNPSKHNSKEITSPENHVLSVLACFLLTNYQIRKKHLYLHSLFWPLRPRLFKRKDRVMRKKLSFNFSTTMGAIIFVVVSFIASGQAFAIGGQHYPNGAEDFVVGILPPPGNYFINYLGYISKDELRDADGDKVPVDFDAGVIAEVPRFIYVSDKEILGASWAAHIFVPLYSADVEVKAGGDTLVNEDSAGLGDIIISPFILGWHFSPQFHLVATVDTYVPTGNYDEDDPSTQLLSRNHWTFEPVVAMTYLAGNWDFSLKLMYDINTDNDDYVMGGEKGTLDPGDEFHFDYAIGYMYGDWEFGVNGFYYEQVTDDEFEGQELDDSKCKIAGIGPAIKWWPNKGRYSVVLKHMQEYGAENMPEGSQTWLKAIVAF